MKMVSQLVHHEILVWPLAFLYSHVFLHYILINLLNSLTMDMFITMFLHVLFSDEPVFLHYILIILLNSLTTDMVIAMFLHVLFSDEHWTIKIHNLRLKLFICNCMYHWALHLLCFPVTSCNCVWREFCDNRIVLILCRCKESNIHEWNKWQQDRTNVLLELWYFGKYHIPISIKPA